jgi:site-specific DNA recombinase
MKRLDLYKEKVPSPQLVAVYMRVSSEEQREKETILTQRSEMEPWLRERGYEVVEWYADDGVSGDVPFHKRRDGARLLEDARAGRFGTVVVFKIDRLSRRAEDALSVVRMLHEDMGLMFRCSAQDFEINSSTGKLTLTMMAAIAEFAKSNILENTRAGHKRRAIAGKWPMGRCAYGYRPAGESELQEAVRAGLEPPTEGALVVHPLEGPVVQRIFRLYREGLGMGKIAIVLNGEGVPPPRPGKHKRPGQRSLFKWNVSTLSFILHNHIYTGETLFYRTKTLRRDGVVVGLEERPEGDHVPIPCPALVSEEEFALVQELMGRNQEFSPRNRKRNYLLSGLAVCGCCGMRYVGYAKKSRKTPGLEWRYYSCSSGWNKAKAEPCDNHQVRASEVEPLVWGRVRRALQNPEEFVEEILEQHRASIPQGDDMDDLRRRLAALEASIEAKSGEERRLVTAYRKGLLGDTEPENEAVFEEEKRSLSAEVGQLRQEADRLRHSIQPGVDLDAEVANARAVLAVLAEGLDNAEADEDLRRQFVMALVSQVQVFCDGVRSLLKITYRPRLFCLAAGGAGVSNCVQSHVRNWTQLEHTETLPLAA